MVLPQNPMSVLTADSATLEKISVLREIIQAHRVRAVEGWNSCAVKEETDGNSGKETVGKFTEQLHNG